MKKLRTAIVSFVAALFLVSGVALLNGGSTASADALVFTATFDSASDFYDRFDYGLSGFTPAGRDDPEVDGAGGVFPIHGDHNMSCGDPTTSRDLRIHGEQWNNGDHFPDITFDELFWHCAPGNDPAKGHVMFNINTTGYNHIWFAPKGYFSNITKVCWDQNLNSIRGKWQELHFVDAADATRYPTGSRPTDSVTARGTGGFDLGFTDPSFRAPDGPNTGITPQSGTLAGLNFFAGIYAWFQNQDTWTANQVGWPGIMHEYGYNGGQPITDKATRYKHCLEQVAPNQLRVTFNSPTGPMTRNFTGQIPQQPVRVVWHDSNYDAPKRGGYNAEMLTSHMDNIEIFTANGTPVPTTTTTVAPTTTTTSTTVPSTTTSTTLPTTTTSTTVPTTTTVPQPVFKFPVYATDPVNPAVGQAWLNSTTNQVKVKLANGNVRVL